MRGVSITVLTILLIVVGALLIGKWLRDVPGARTRYVGSLSSVSSVSGSLQTSQEEDCPLYLQPNRTYFLSLFVTPVNTPPGGLLTYFVNGSNPHTTDYFNLTAMEINISSVQTFQIPACPDPGGWVLLFSTPRSDFKGRVGYCTFGHNLGRVTPLEGNGVLLHSYLPMVLNSNAEWVGYLTTREW